MCDFPMRPVTVINTLSGLIGIHSNVINFGKIANSDVASYRYKWQPYIFYFAFGIAFAVSFPVTSYQLLLNHHSWAPQSINFYVNCLYYSSRYFAVVSVFFMQVWYRRESYACQCETINIFRQIYDINRCLCANDKECKRRTMALNVIDWWQIVKFIVAIVCYTCTNYLKLTNVFRRPSSMNTYDLFWFYYANIFIRVYATIFSISILQQAKLFELLNHTIKAIKRATDESLAFIPTTVPSAAVRFINGASRQSKCRANGAQQHATHYLPGDFENLIQLMMQLHDQLRANSLKLDKLHSIQAFEIVAYGFMNMVSQVERSLFFLFFFWRSLAIRKEITRNQFVSVLFCI